MLWGKKVPTFSVFFPYCYRVLWFMFFSKHIVEQIDVRLFFYCRVHGSRVKGMLSIGGVAVPSVIVRVLLF